MGRSGPADGDAGAVCGLAIDFGVALAPNSLNEDTVLVPGEGMPMPMPSLERVSRAYGTGWNVEPFVNSDEFSINLSPNFKI